MISTEVTQRIQQLARCMQNNELLYYEDSPQNSIWHNPHGIIANSDEILCELPLRKNTDGIHWYAYLCSHDEAPHTFASGLAILLKRPEGDSLDAIFNHFYLLAMQSCMPTTYHHNSKEVYRESDNFLSALEDMSCIISSFNGGKTSDEDACYDRFDIQIYIPILSNTENIDIRSGLAKTSQ